MMNILELLKNEKVEWKKLKDVLLSINTGLNPRKNFILNDSSGNLTSWYITTKDYSQTEKIEFIEGKTAKITEEARQIINKRSKLEKGDLLFSAVGTVGKIALVEIETNNFDVNESTFVLKPNYNIINNKYLMYCLRCNIFQNMLKSNLKGSTLSGVRKGDLENFEVPIPSLETQEKIVEILDKFTNYVTELQSELQSRTKQYTYYRDKLLSEEYLTKVTKEMEEDRRLKIFKLDEIFDFKNGLNKGKEYFGKGVPFISYVNVYKLDRLHEQDIIEKVELTQDEIARFSVEKGDVLFTRTSEVKEEVGYSSVVIEDLNNTVFNGFTIRARLKNSDLLLPEYSAHLFRCHEIRKEIIRRSSFTTRASLSGQELGKVKVVIPPLSLQNKIVKVLDKFQVLLADTKGLLPAEIEERQKQYEYYREKLLTFDVECSRTNERTFIISNIYYDILQKAAIIVEVDIEDRVEWEKVSNFCKRQKGINITAKEMKELAIEDGTVKVFAGGNTVAYLDVEIVGKDNIIDKPSIIVKSRGNIDFEYYDGMFSHKNEMWSYSINSENNIKYLYYYLKNNIEYFRSRAISGKLPQIATGITDNYKIPLPPLHVQQHVVNILDKFDTLVNDIKEGLPKEIEQRQQQYEYWRECLLNFPR